MSENHRTRVGIERRNKMRMRLIESALAVFAEKGVDVSVIDDVIAAAGVSRGTFYNYFRTNDEILSAVAQELNNDVVGVIEKVVKDFENPVARLACGLRKFLITCEEYPLLARFTWRAGFSLYNNQNLMLVYLPRHINEAIELGDFKVFDTLFALEFIAGVMLSSTFALTTHPVADDYPQSVVQHILMGLGLTEAKARRFANLDLPEFYWEEDSFLNRAQAKFLAESTS